MGNDARVTVVAMGLKEVTMALDVGSTDDGGDSFLLGGLGQGWEGEMCACVCGYVHLHVYVYVHVYVPVRVSVYLRYRPLTMTLALTCQPASHSPLPFTPTPRTRTHTHLLIAKANHFRQYTSILSLGKGVSE